MAAATTPEENAAAAAVDAIIAEMTNRFTINTDDADAGPLKLDDVDGNVYSCKHCRTELAVADDIISKSFYCKNGKAYLFDKVINVTVGEKEDRMMITGMHSISDIFCVGCGEIERVRLLAGSGCCCFFLAVQTVFSEEWEDQRQRLRLKLRAAEHADCWMEICISCLDLNEDMTRWHTVFSVALWLWKGHW